MAPTLPLTPPAAVRHPYWILAAVCLLGLMSTVGVSMPYPILAPIFVGGPVDAFADSKMVKPSKEHVYGSIEGLIQHFELIMSNRGWKAPIAEHYAAVETAGGELGYHIVSDGGPRPWRVRTRPPCFINYSVMQKMMEGHMLSDIPAVLGSINVVAAELDR